MSDGGPRNTLQVPFGLKDGRLYEPTQVDNGLRCGCACPGCGATLIARHSPSGKVTPHFANACDTVCTGGLESALHIAAKQLIADRRELYLPQIVATVEVAGVSGALMVRSEVVRDGTFSFLNHVRLEEKLGVIRPDLIVSTFEEDILVEIAKTSFVTPDKLEYIESRGVPAIEVDTSDLVTLNFKELEKRLFEPTPRAKWIYHPEQMARELALQLLMKAVRWSSLKMTGR